MLALRRDKSCIFREKINQDKIQEIIKLDWKRIKIVTEWI